MSAYTVTVKGKEYDVDAPDEQTAWEWANQYHEKASTTAPDTSRTWGEAFTDIPAALVKGAGSALKIPGSLVKLAPGMTDIGEAMERPGEAISSFGESLESKGLKARQLIANKAMSEAEKDGVLASFATAIKSTVTDPALLSTFLAEQLPQLIGPGGAAKITTMLGKKGIEALAEGAAKKEAVKVLGAKATSAAVGTGAVMQGADIGSDTYDAAMKLLKEQSPDMPEDERRSIALAKARMAAAEAGVISLASQKLPGAKAIEQRMAGLPGAGRIKSALGEAASEIAEEGGGKLASNFNLQQIDPNIKLTQGVGTAAGLGAIGGGTLGGVLGAHHGEERAVPGVDANGLSEIDRLRAAQAAAESPQAAPGAETTPPAAPTAPAAPTILSPDDLFQLATSENGYGKLEQYYQTLGQQRKTKEVKAAMQEAANLRRQLNTEMLGRILPRDATGNERESAFTNATPDMFGEFTTANNPEPESNTPKPVDRGEHTTQDAVPGLETFPLSHLTSLGVPKAAPIVKAYEKEGLKAVDLNDAGKLQTLIERITNWTNNAKNSDKPGIANAREQLTSVLPILQDRLSNLQEDAGHAAQPTVEAPQAPTQEPTQQVPQAAPPAPVAQPTVRERGSKPVPNPTAPVQQELASDFPTAEEMNAEQLNALQGPQNATGTVPPTSGNGVRVPVQPQAQSTAQGSAGTQPSGVVPTQPNAPAANAGKGRQSSTVESEPVGQVHRKRAKDNVGVALQNALDSKTKSAPYRKQNPGFIPVPMLQNIKTLLNIQNDPKVSESDRARAKDALEENFTAKEIAAAASYKPADLRHNIVTPGTNVPVNTTLTELLKKGDVRKALQLITVTYGGNHLVGMVSLRLLNAGFMPKLTMVPSGSLGADANTGATVAALYDPVTDTIRMTEDSISVHHLLHEVVHGFLSRKIDDFLNGRGDAQIKRINDLYEHIKATRPDLAEQYGMTNLHEFASEAMSNEAFQQELQNIPYRKTSIFTAFAQSVLRLLGISDKVPTWNALAEALISVESAMKSGRQLQEARIGMSGTARNVIPQGTQTTAIGENKDVETPLTAMDVKVKLVDSLASVDDLFTKAYGGKVRDASGNLNPIVLMSRALDALRVSYSVLATGGLTKQNGVFGASVLIGPDGSPISYKSTVDFITAEAKRRGTTFEALKREFDETLYGHREFHMREENRQMEQVALALDAKGDAKSIAQAQEIRDAMYKPLLTDAAIDAREAQFNSDQAIQKVSKDLDAIRFNLLDAMVESGRLSAEQAQALKDNIGYIPFNRIGDFAARFKELSTKANRGVAMFKARKEIAGSDRKVTSVIESFGGLVDWMTGETLRNEAALKGLKDMVLLGNARQVLGHNAVANDAAGKVIEVFDDGEKTYYHVLDPAQVVAFSLSDPQVSQVVRKMQKASQILRAGVTVLPPFAFRQVAEDISRAYAYAGVKHPAQMTARILMNFPVEWFNELFGKKSDTVKQLERFGVIGSFGFTPQSNTKSIMQQAGVEKKGMGARILEVMEAGAKASDVAVRKAIYDQTMKETNDPVLAESRSREIINFSRRGSSKAMSLMISAVPFFNSYAQGMGKLATAAAGGKFGASVGVSRSMFYQRMGIMTAMGLAYALMMANDDDYWKQGDDIRDRNWILPFGKHLGFTPVIPVAPELGFIFKSIPERVVQYYKLQGTAEEKKALTVLSEMVRSGIDVYSSPNLQPQVIRPFLENLANYSFNLGRPLESQSQQGLRPFERYGMGTSEVSKSIASGLESLHAATDMDWFTVSPIKIENLIRGLTGTSSAVALQVGDAMLNPNRTDRPLQQSLGAVLTGAGAFMKDEVGTRYQDELYRLSEQVEQVHATYNRLSEKSNPEEAAKFMLNNQGAFMYRDVVKHIADQMKEISKIQQTNEKLKVGTPASRLHDNVMLKRAQQELARMSFEIHTHMDYENK